MIPASRPPRTRSLAAFAVAILVSLLLPAAGSAQTWDEDPTHEDVDADDIVGQTTELDPADTELSLIQGRLQFHEDVDLYRVRIAEFLAFRMAATGSSDNIDPKVYLFYGDGRGIAARDDGVPSNSNSANPTLTLDCEDPDPDDFIFDLCEIDLGDTPLEYLLGITRHDIIPRGPNPSAGLACPDGSTPDGDDTCPIFPSTMRWVTKNGTRVIDFSEIVFPHPGMESQSVSKWKVVNPPPELNTNAQNCNLVGDYLVNLERVLYAREPEESAAALAAAPRAAAAQAAAGGSGPVDCIFVPEPSSSAWVGCGAVLLLRAMRGSRRS
ncbi:MAG: hypothetical protein JRH19_18860 [Deltaproteobacteria bacterium]|nr:hypothetical protein [Deltaproteobacteria bacterium]